MGHRAWRIQGLLFFPFLNHHLPGLDSKVFLVLVVTPFSSPFFSFFLCSWSELHTLGRGNHSETPINSKKIHFDIY